MASNIPALTKAVDTMRTQTLPDSLLAALRENAVLWRVLERVAESGLPDCYVGAGCIAQTVWNHIAGNDPGYGIKDYDIVYFSEDRSQQAENIVSARIKAQLADLDIRVDVKNQARVHLWYPQRFGYHVVPYASTADAISTWPTTATAVGITGNAENVVVCAPFGLDDLLNCTVRPNRVQITREIYNAKVQRWSQRWPSLTFLEWEDGVGAEALRWVGT